MTALSSPRSTPSLETGKNVFRTFPVAANAIIYPGAQVALNATGYLVPVTALTTLTVIGIAVPKRQQMTRLLGYIDATGLADGAMECEVQSCIALMVNGSTSITKADVGKDCYAVDDQTVAKTNGGATRSRAGKVVAVDAQGVSSRVSVRAAHRGAGDKKLETYECMGYYHDRWVRSTEGWRIQHRAMVVKLEFGSRKLLGPAAAPD